MKISINKLTTLAMLLAISIVLSWLENFIPTFILGVKIGLANIVSLIVLYIYDSKHMFLVVILRVFIVSLILSTFLNVTFYMSLSGAIFSSIAMIIVKKLNIFSIVGVSLCGAIFHSIGQIVVTFILLESFLSIYYLPLILFLSILCGIFTGLVANRFLKYYTLF